MRKATKNQLKFAIGLGMITGLILLAVGLAPIAAFAITLSAVTFIFLSVWTITLYINRARLIISDISDTNHFSGAPSEPEVTPEQYQTASEAIQANLGNIPGVNENIMGYYCDKGSNPYAAKRFDQAEFENKQTVKIQQEAYLSEQKKKVEPAAENPEVRANREFLNK